MRLGQGAFNENDDFSAILKLKSIAYLENGNLASSTEAQLQSSHHDLSHESHAPGRNVRRRSSQRVLYYDFVKLEFQRLLTRSKERAQAISQPGDDYDKTRYRNWLSLINRTSDEAVERPLQARYDQKMAKYGHVAEQNNLRFIPAVFSHTGQIHDDFKALVREQIRYKLIDVEGEPKSSKIRAVMKWWTRCISMAIAKTASRNVAFKVARMRDAIMKDQDEFITREVNFDDGALVANDRANLDDVVCNADLYIANQEDFTQGAISQS